MFTIHFLECSYITGSSSFTHYQSYTQFNDNSDRLIALLHETTDFPELYEWLLTSKTIGYDDYLPVSTTESLSINIDFEENPEQLYVRVFEFDWRRKPYHAPITRQNMIQLVKLWPFMEANNEEVFLVFDGYTYTLYGDADKKYVMKLIRNDLILQLECVLLLAMGKKQEQAS